MFKVRFSMPLKKSKLHEFELLGKFEKFEVKIWLDNGEKESFDGRTASKDDKMSLSLLEESDTS